MASCLFFPSPTLQSLDPPENKFLGVYHVSLLKILGMEFLPDWHPHLRINYANSIHQRRSKQHCQTVDFTEATDTGIAFSSVLMQINSPITDISAIHARFRSHHVKVVGKPAYIVQTIRWIKCAVAAKSRHWKRSIPYIHSINFYMHQCTCCHNFVLFLLHGRRCYKLCETLKH